MVEIMVVSTVQISLRWQLLLLWPLPVPLSLCLPQKIQAGAVSEDTVLLFHSGLGKNPPPHSPGPQPNATYICILQSPGLSLGLGAWNLVCPKFGE